MKKPHNLIDQYNVIWNSQSRNSSESMPVSGGDIGLNVWVENNELLFYIARAGCRDENGALLKLGRVRIKLNPNPFLDAPFRQELCLREGCVKISSDDDITLWIEIHRPVIHVDIRSEEAVTVEVTYESWRFDDIELPNDPDKHDRRSMCMINYDGYPGTVTLHRDEIRAQKEYVRFHHRVKNAEDSFNFQVRQQGLEPVRDQLVNPLENLVWGGALVGDGFSFAGETSGHYAECPFRRWKYVSNAPANTHRIRVCLHTAQTADQERWDSVLGRLIDASVQSDREAREKTQNWWSDFWNRSHLVINSGRGERDPGWRIGRNYQLFRYMLAANAHGNDPTIFNGGLFNFDPLFVNGKRGPGYSPDHRQWGAAYTAQNQRLVYRPMLKTGDFDLLLPGFSYYLNGLPNAMARVRHYWNHDGCAFEEQSAIGGLPGACQYGFVEGGRRGRPEDCEVGVQVNQAGGMIYEEQLDWSWLILQYHGFSGRDIGTYLPFIEQSVIFFDEHYRFRRKQISGDEFDENGKLAFYPANSLEAHWNARNPTSLIAGLRRVLTALIDLPERYGSPEKSERWQETLDRLPEMPKETSDTFGGTFLKPAENYEHKSWHCPEMFPLYPYELYGIGMSDLDLMKRTSLSTGDNRHDATSWEQANIHAARLGETDLARDLNLRKMENGPYRFPAFWPQDIDWAPDHNWGGSGMIGLQEMLMQTHGNKIRLLAAWPKEWEVKFKLHAPQQTIVEGTVKEGELANLKVNPEKKQENLIVM